MFGGYVNMYEIVVAAFVDIEVSPYIRVTRCLMLPY